MDKPKKYKIEKKTEPTVPPEPADEAKAGYAVGYGKPPKSKQFKSGLSGNPKGRPKGVKNIETVIKEEVYSKVPVIVGGKKKKLSKVEVAIKRLVEKALKGDLKALAMLLSLMKEHVAPTSSSTALLCPPTADEIAILEDLVAFEKMLKEFKNE